MGAVNPRGSREGFTAEEVRVPSLEGGAGDEGANSCGTASTGWDRVNGVRVRVCV